MNKLEQLVLDYNKDKKPEEQISVPVTSFVKGILTVGDTYVKDDGTVKLKIAIGNASYTISEAQLQRRFLALKNKESIVTLQHCIEGKTVYLSDAPNGFSIHSTTGTFVQDICPLDKYSEKQNMLNTMLNKIRTDETLSIKEKIELELTVINML